MMCEDHTNLTVSELKSAKSEPNYISPDERLSKQNNVANSNPNFSLTPYLENERRLS